MKHAECGIISYSNSRMTVKTRTKRFIFFFLKCAFSIIGERLFMYQSFVRKEAACLLACLCTELPSMTLSGRAK